MLAIKTFVVASCRRSVIGVQRRMVATKEGIAVLKENSVPHSRLLGYTAVAGSSIVGATVWSVNVTVGSQVGPIKDDVHKLQEDVHMLKTNMQKVTKNLGIEQDQGVDIRDGWLQGHHTPALEGTAYLDKMAYVISENSKDTNGLADSIEEAQFH